MELLLIDAVAGIGTKLEKLMKLEEPNVHLTQVFCCDTGLDQIRQRRFDCVILDQTVVNKNGLDCLRFIREMNPALPVVILTGEVTDDLKAQYKKAGADKFVVKPFLNQLFGPVVKAAIEQRQKFCEVFAKRDRMLTQLRNAI